MRRAGWLILEEVYWVQYGYKIMLKIIFCALLMFFSISGITSRMEDEVIEVDIEGSIYMAVSSGNVTDEMIYQYIEDQEG
jgi:hypothetical protein